MTAWEAIIVAIVEGLTEFLPVSSTGHMIITQSVLGIESTGFVRAFTVMIQFGAILSVIVLYPRRFFQLKEAQGTTILRRVLSRFDFYVKLFIAFIPAAIAGVLFGDHIDALLESVLVVAIMLIVGGVFMLFCDQIWNKGTEDTPMTNRRALLIGVFQCIAMIPGVSRSMATIVGGMTQRLTRKAAAEFSFFLAVPTMFAATAYSLFKLIKEEPAGVIMDNVGTLLLGNVVAFVVALAAIKFFINFLTKYGFRIFGWYRIVVGTLILILLLTGHELTI